MSSTIDQQYGGSIAVPPITVDTTVTVKVSGGDFTSIADAIQWASEQVVTLPSNIFISIDPGVWVVDTGVNLSGRQNVYLQGVSASETVTITSTGTVSGSAGNYSVVLNLSSWPAAGISVDNIIQIYSSTGNATAGLLRGGWRVTGTNQGGNQVTVLVTSNVAPAGSTAITTGSSKVVRTVLKRTTAGNVLIANSTVNRECMSIKDIGIWSSDNTASSNGLFVQNSEVFYSGSIALIGGGVYGLYVYSDGSVIGAPASILTVTSRNAASRRGIIVGNQSRISAARLISSGNTDDGMYVTHGSSVFAEQMSLCGNASFGAFCTDSSKITCQNTILTQGNANTISPAANTTGNTGSFITPTTTSF